MYEFWSTHSITKMSRLINPRAHSLLLLLLCFIYTYLRRGTKLSPFVLERKNCCTIVQTYKSKLFQFDRSNLFTLRFKEYFITDTIRHFRNITYRMLTSAPRPDRDVLWLMYIFCSYFIYYFFFFLVD